MSTENRWKLLSGFFVDADETGWRSSSRKFGQSMSVGWSPRMRFNSLQDSARFCQVAPYPQSNKLESSFLYCQANHHQLSLQFLDNDKNIQAWTVFSRRSNTSTALLSWCSNCTQNITHPSALHGAGSIGTCSQQTLSWIAWPIAAESCSQSTCVCVSLLPEQWMRNCLQIENQAAVSTNYSNIWCDWSRCVFGLGQKGILDRKFGPGPLQNNGQLENLSLRGCFGNFWGFSSTPLEHPPEPFPSDYKGNPFHQRVGGIAWGVL